MDIRLFRDSDRDGLISLLQTTFDGWHPDPRSHWNWLYENNPQGQSSIGVAVEDGSIVASYSACPVLMQWGGQRTIAGLGIDAATHPGFRRRGLFEQVAKTAIADAERRRFGFILAYTPWGGASAIGQIEKLGFKRAFMIKRLVKVLNWPRAIAARLKLPGRPPTAAEVVDKIHATVTGDPKHDISVAREVTIEETGTPSASTREIRVEKSQRYVRWRYSENPDKQYQIVSAVSPSNSPAYIVLALRIEKTITVGQIVDVFGDDKSSNALLSGLEKTLSASGVTLLEAYISAGHRAAKMMTSHGYRDRPYAVAGIMRPTSNASPEGVELASIPEACQTMLADDASL
jgi:ribosomal protein S18 acetylase RimI-like enzyme